MNLLSDKEESEIISRITTGLSKTTDIKLSVLTRYLVYVYPEAKTDTEISSEALGDDGLDNLAITDYLINNLLEYGLLETKADDEERLRCPVKKYSLTKKGIYNYGRGMSYLISAPIIYLINPVLIGMVIFGLLSTIVFSLSLASIDVLTFIFAYQNHKLRMSKWHQKKG